MDENRVGRAVALRMEALHREWREQNGVHEVCEGVFFVTKPETITALAAYFEEFSTFAGFRVMVPNERGRQCLNSPAAAS